MTQPIITPIKLPFQFGEVDANNPNLNIGYIIEDKDAASLDTDYPLTPTTRTVSVSYAWAGEAVSIGRLFYDTQIEGAKDQVYQFAPLLALAHQKGLIQASFAVQTRISAGNHATAIEWPQDASTATN